MKDEDQIECWRVWLEEYPDEGSVTVFTNAGASKLDAGSAGAELLDTDLGSVTASRVWWTEGEDDGLTIARDAPNEPIRRAATPEERDLVEEVLLLWTRLPDN